MDCFYLTLGVDTPTLETMGQTDMGWFMCHQSVALLCPFASAWRNSGLSMAPFLLL